MIGLKRLLTQRPQDSKTLRTKKPLARLFLLSRQVSNLNSSDVNLLATIKIENE